MCELPSDYNHDTTEPAWRERMLYGCAAPRLCHDESRTRLGVGYTFLQRDVSPTTTIPYDRTKPMLCQWTFFLRTNKSYSLNANVTSTVTHNLQRDLFHICLDNKKTTITQPLASLHAQARPARRGHRPGAVRSSRGTPRGTRRPTCAPYPSSALHPSCCAASARM